MTTILDVFPNALDGPAVAKGHKGGTQRTVPPQQTLETVAPLMPRMGITRIAEITGLDRIGLPVTMVTRPNARSIAVSQGKGIDRKAAMASGLMESIEIFHAEHIDLPLVESNQLELSWQHRTANAKRLPIVTGSLFRVDLPILWVEGYDLINRETKWVPFECVSADFTVPRPRGTGCFDASTNGLASGNDMLEAVSHGIAEVVERDATTLWNRKNKGDKIGSRVDHSTVEDDACRALIKRIEDAEFEIGLFDATSDTAIPSYVALLMDQRQDLAHIGLGSGCHPNPDIAVIRALTEAVQVRTTYISGARDDLAIDEYGEAEQKRRRTWVAELLGGKGERQAYNADAGLRADQFNEDITWMLDRLQSVDILEAIAVNLTRPDLNVPVARIIIPGLEGPDDHDRYVPGARAGQGDR